MLISVNQIWGKFPLTTPRNARARILMSELQFSWSAVCTDQTRQIIFSHQHFILEPQFRHHNRRFPKITGEDNLTVFSYSGRVKSPEWRWEGRRADQRHFEIFRHGPIIIYTRLPAGGTYCPICTFPAISECLIGISDAFSAFCLRPSSSPRARCTPNKSVPTLRYTRRLLPSAVPWISEDRLLPNRSREQNRQQIWATHLRVHICMYVYICVLVCVCTHLHASGVWCIGQGHQNCKVQLKLQLRKSMKSLSLREKEKKEKKLQS